MKNQKVFFLALLGLVFAVLGYLVNWIFFALAVAIMIYNQRLLMKKIRNS